MSQRIGTVDIVVGGQPLKIGEMTFNDDNTLEGFLFENSAAVVQKIMETNPQSVIFSVMVTSDEAEQPKREVVNVSVPHDNHFV